MTDELKNIEEQTNIDTSSENVDETTTKDVANGETPTESSVEAAIDTPEKTPGETSDKPEEILPDTPADSDSAAPNLKDLPEIIVPPLPDDFLKAPKRDEEYANEELDEDEEDEEDEEEEQPPKKKREGVSIVIQVVVTFIAAMVLFVLIKMFVAGTYEIPSSSMEDTIAIGDLIVSERVSYHFRDPQPGEIVTFDDPMSPGRTLIKRVIATEGHVINFDLNGNLLVDGIIQNESYVKEGMESYPLEPPTGTEKIKYPYTVPEGCVWVMGDNRENSGDSRYFGPVPIESINGHAVFTYWPVEHWGGF